MNDTLRDLVIAKFNCASMVWQAAFGGENLRHAFNTIDNAKVSVESSGLLTD
jgi:hypothetical protein